MSAVLYHQREKINEILQIFENFGNQTQEMIINHEQGKKKEAERIDYFENYYTDFEKNFMNLELFLKRSQQEKEFIISRINSIIQKQKSLQETEEISLNSLSNQVSTFYNGTLSYTPYPID